METKNQNSTLRQWNRGCRWISQWNCLEKDLICFIGLEDCVRDLTFSFDETVKHGTLGPLLRVDLKNQTFWSSTVENTAVGMCHTFIYPDEVAADMMNDAIYFSLDTNLRCHTDLMESVKLVDVSVTKSTYMTPNTTPLWGTHLYLPGYSVTSKT